MADAQESSAVTKTDEKGGSNNTSDLLDKLTKQAKEGTPIDGLDLSEAKLSNAALDGAVFKRCILSGAQLDGASLKGAKLVGCSLNEAFLSGADFSDADLSNADLEGATLKAARFVGANLTRANLEGADLTEADLTKARLVHAQLDGARLGSAKLINAVLRYVVAEETYFGSADLTNADLQYATLRGANVESAILSRVRLNHAVLESVEATKADFRKASLLKADLRQAVLADANLQGVDLRHVELTGAELKGVKLTGARIAHAIGTGSPIENIQVLWLDTSTRGDGSERLSNGQIPALLSGIAPITSEPTSNRYIGRGDVIRDANLRFAAGSKVEIHGLLERCEISLGDRAELIIAHDGVLADCTVEGSGRIVVEGKFFEGKRPGIVGPRELLVCEHGALMSVVKQGDEPARFGFEPGSRLKMKILASN